MENKNALTFFRNEIFSTCMPCLFCSVISNIQLVLSVCWVLVCFEHSNLVTVKFLSTASYMWSVSIYSSRFGRWLPNWHRTMEELEPCAECRTLASSINICLGNVLYVYVDRLCGQRRPSWWRKLQYSIYHYFSLYSTLEISNCSCANTVCYWFIKS